MNATVLNYINSKNKVASAIALALSLSACGQGFRGNPGEVGNKQHDQSSLGKKVYSLSAIAAEVATEPTAQVEASTAADDSDQEGIAADSVAPDQDAAQVSASDFKAIDLVPNAEDNIMEKYKYIDPKHQIDSALLKKAVTYFFVNQNHLSNRSVITVIDFSRPSSEKRLFVINMQNGQMWSTYVAHGSGSDRNGDGIAEGFSNKVNSNASSVGAYLAMMPYSGKHGNSLRLKGLSETNSNAFVRNIVVHGASYVHDEPILQGKSWGCIAVAPQYSNKFISLIKGGSLIYAGLSNPSIAHQF